jgi:hypothetical protein
VGIDVAAEGRGFDLDLMRKRLALWGLSWSNGDDVVVGNARPPVAVAEEESGWFQLDAPEEVEVQVEERDGNPEEKHDLVEVGLPGVMVDAISTQVVRVKREP